MNGGAALSAKLKALNRYQKAVLIAMAAMILVFTALYAVTTGRVGYEYHGATLVPSGESGGTVYSGRIGGESAVFTVYDDGSVEFRLGNTLYGPYTAREAPSAVPEGYELSEHMTGLELRRAGEIIFRGGVLDSGNSFRLYDEDGSPASIGIVAVTSDGTVIDGSGNAVDPMEPGAHTLLELMSGPELTHKGSWWGYFAGVFACLITAASILYADELFRWQLSFSIRNAGGAEPSD